MKHLKKSVGYVAIIIAALFFSKCTLTEDLAILAQSVDSLKIMVGTPKFNTSMHFEFVDAKTGEPILDKDVSVSISGKDAALVYNNIGSKQSSYSSRRGMLDLVIDPRKDTSSFKTNPIQFELLTNLAGYVSSPINISIYDAKRKNIVVPLTNINNPPEGTIVFENINLGSTDLNGAIKETTSINLSKGKSNRFNVNNITEYSMNIKIPAGAILKDFDGNILKGDVVIRYAEVHGLAKEEKTAVIINEWINPKLFNKYLSYGLHILVQSSKGYEVVRYIENGDIKVNITLPSLWINPITNSPIKENDIFEQWGFNQSSLNSPFLFKPVKNDTIKNNNGKLLLNGNKLVQYWGFESQVCPNRPIFNLNGVNLSIEEFANYKAYLNGVNYTNTHVNFGYDYKLSESTHVVSISPIIPLGTTVHKFIMPSIDVDITYKFNPESITINNICETNTYNINVSEIIDPKIKFVNAKLDIGISSKSNKNFVIKPNMWLYTKEFFNNTRWKGYEVINGITTMKIKLNKRYELEGYLGVNSFSGMFQIDEKGVEYIVSLFNKNVLYKTISFPKNSNILDVKYDFVISDNVFNQLQ